MNLIRHRPYLRALTPQQRRVWWAHKNRLQSRVRIGSLWVPDRVRRSYAYALRS